MFELSKITYEANRKFAIAVSDLNLDEMKLILNGENGRVININAAINESAYILYAAQKKRWDVVEFFYDNGADLDVSSGVFGWSLFHECIKNAPDNVCKAMAEYCDINVQTKAGISPIMVAIKEKPDMANFLLDNFGVNLSLLDKEGNNVAHYAAKEKEYDVLLKLAEKGALLNLKNKEGETAVDLIEDLSFKESLPKMISIIGVRKSVAPNIASGIDKNEAKNSVIYKASGLSEIKRIRLS